LSVIYAYARITDIGMKNYLVQIQDFLHSGTKEAKATQVALAIVAVASLPFVMMIAVSMGNAVQIFRKFPTGKKYNKKEVFNAFKHLKREKLIEYISSKDGQTVIRITRKGQGKLYSFAIDKMVIKKCKKWDGKWRLVTFDLPIRFNKARNALRFKLKQLGFVQFQKSLWIYPYPCEEEILFIADYFKVAKYVEILEVNSITRDVFFRKHFKLN